MRAIVILVVLLAGCADEPLGLAVDADATDPQGGGMRGIVRDDRGDPVPDATILLSPIGVTTKTDAEGRFAIAGLAPDWYRVFADKDGHEAAPLTERVRAHAWTDLEIEARRTSN